MSFKDLDINISYKSVGEESFSEILNPLLSSTKTYKRSVGFFSSSALSFIGDGILKMARNGGHIFLATSPRLSEEDFIAIKNGYDQREMIRTRFLEDLSSTLQVISDENAKILSDLIKENILDIKIVLKNNGIYHDKLAVLEDYEGNKIACVGSNNESEPGYHSNYEKVRIYKSWTDNEGRVQDECSEFESIWNDSNEFLQVFDFMDALQSELIERIRYEGAYKDLKKKNKYTMRPYQIEAKDNWVNNGHNGFFVMATGTGKTITSLFSIKDLITNNKIFTVIAVPYKHLVNQWYDDVKEFFKDAYIQLVYGEINNAESKIYTNYIAAKNNYKPFIVVTTIKSFFLSKFSKLYDKIEFDKLLIVDEAHNFINCIDGDLSQKYKYKLGLSATPVFGTDVDKTKNLLNWFGGIAENFPIEKAIGKYLVNYEYHPIFVNATENDEKAFAKATTLMLSGIDVKRKIIIDEKKFTLGYRGRLRAISMAEEKTNQIENIFNQVKSKDHTIIYCSDGKSDYEDVDLRHLEQMLILINRSIITRGDRLLKASKFTASEDVETRMNLIDCFNKGNINYLVAIKCLDEGINIPSIKSALILSSNDNYREFVQRRGRILRLFKQGGYVKEKADIYDVIVLPSLTNKPFAEIELRRFQEYSKLALNKDELDKLLNEKLVDYNLTRDDVKFKNEFILGGELDD